jgi:hypothetical protein
MLVAFSISTATAQKICYTTEAVNHRRAIDPLYDHLDGRSRTGLA